MNHAMVRAMQHPRHWTIELSGGYYDGRQIQISKDGCPHFPPEQWLMPVPIKEPGPGTGPVYQERVFRCSYLRELDSVFVYRLVNP